MSIGSQELCVFVTAPHLAGKGKREQEKLWLDLAVRKARGSYHRVVAMRTFMSFGKRLAKKYAKEFKQKVNPWYCDKKQPQFTRQDLYDFADSQSKAFEAAYKEGTFEPLLPPKLQSRATREKTAAAMAVADKQRNHSIGEHYGEEGKRPAKQHWENKRAKAWWKKHPHHDDNVCSWKAGHTGKCDAWPGKGSKKKRSGAGASRGGRVPSGAVKPHPSKRSCKQCGRIHTKRVHWSHGAAPKGGKAGGYKKKRAGR